MTKAKTLEKMTTTIQRKSNLYDELKSIRKEIEQEKVSMGDVAFLTAHQTEIKEYFPDDVVLWQWAGIPENESEV